MSEPRASRMPTFKRMPEREVLRAKADDSRTVGRGDVSRPIDRTRVDEQHFEIAIPLPVERREHFGKPALLVERPDDDAGFW